MMKRITVMLIGFALVVLTACANDSNSLDSNDNLNISNDSTEKPSHKHMPLEPTRNARNGMPPESTWYDPLKNPEAKRIPPRRQADERPPEFDNTTNPDTTRPSQGMNEFTSAVISLTNEEREKLGLDPLIADETLTRVALEKARSMQQDGYFSHNSPTYGSPFEMMNQFGVTYKSAGENIARGQPAPQEVVNAWMDSPGHRANIVNRNYTHIGVGYVANGHYWSQMFIER
ncbi:uncharacterized protein JNUCC1_01402 [Lentibacillus sp. JNUCC-1]|uniref:CAP domain-containing protein n=1 Tax=Lentibacillus sp. JNUCC-1 TaxID=2654513 RepID=UPI0013245FA7|nr:CAP domain-containing protein [Lentibacillus sp. JNUCC-1]MUV37596.1 uncharacterized protein [Lentibacillus sp. JNUCC-1]